MSEKKEVRRDKEDEHGFVSYCPQCETKLEIDNFFPTAGWCPKCKAYFYWSTGERVPDRYSFPREISVEIDGERIYHWVASPWMILKAYIKDLWRALVKRAG